MRISCVRSNYGVALVSRIDKIVGLFCKRALQKKRYSAKWTYNFIDPTECSHPIRYEMCCKCFVKAIYRFIEFSRWVLQHSRWVRQHSRWVLQHCTGFARLVWGRLRVHRAFIYSDWFVCSVWFCSLLPRLTLLLSFFGHSTLPPPRGGSASRVSPQSCQSHESLWGSFVMSHI